jgi:branched-chain amino acid transport system permease protein
MVSWELKRMGESLLSGCVTVGIQMILAMSVNIISGYARQLTLGQAAFAALGAYSSAVLNLHFGFSFWLACPLSVLLTGSIGLLFGLPSLRMPRYYLLVMTLGVNALVQRLLRSGRFAGGYFGLGRIAAPHFFAVVLESSTYLPLILAAIGVCIVTDRWFWHSRFGQVLRDSSTEGMWLGATAITRAVLVAFVVSTAMAGLAGSLLAHFETFISPFDFTLETSLFVLALAAWGGLGSLAGAILGTLLLGGLLEIVRPLVGYRLLISGVVFLLVGLWFPRGLLSFSRTFAGNPQSACPVSTSDHILFSKRASPSGEQHASTLLRKPHAAHDRLDHFRDH